MTPAAWEAWKAKALAADAERTHRLTEAQARRPAHPPCADPFCERCVPFGRHLDADVQRRRREAWAAQDRERSRALAQDRKAEAAEGLGWIQDLAALREGAGLTQAALAARVGSAPNTIARIERGERRPGPVLASRLREALAGVQAGH